MQEDIMFDPKVGRLRYKSSGRMVSLEKVPLDHILKEAVIKSLPPKQAELLLHRSDAYRNQSRRRTSGKLEAGR